MRQLLTDFAIGALTTMAIFAMATVIAYLFWLALPGKDPKENENTPKNRKP